MLEKLLCVGVFVSNLLVCNYLQAKELEYQVSSRDIENLVDFTLRDLHKDLVGEWKIQLTDGYIVRIDTHTDPMEVAFADGLCDVNNRIIVVFVYQPCLAASSLIHELMHALGYTHEDREAFMAAEEVQMDAIRHFCGEDYEIAPPPPPSRELLKAVEKRIKELKGQSKRNKHD